MSELQTREPINVREVNIDSIEDPLRHKALLAMQATGLFVEGDAGFEAVNHELQIASKAVGRPPSMTYEDVVLANSDEDIVYVLSDEPDVAQAEAIFYTKHGIVEDHLDRAVHDLMVVDAYRQVGLARHVLAGMGVDHKLDEILGDHGLQGQVEEIADGLTGYLTDDAYVTLTEGIMSREPSYTLVSGRISAAYSLGSGRQGGSIALQSAIPYEMRGLKFDLEDADPERRIFGANEQVLELYDAIEPEYFAAFRKYFVGLNGYDGASGLYTAAIPILDLLVHGGGNIDKAESVKIRRNLEKGLYPMKSGLFTGAQLLGRLTATQTPELDLDASLRIGITDELNRFRRIHRGAVKKFLPEAMTGAAEGSGGVADVASYLASKIVDTKAQKEDE